MRIFLSGVGADHVFTAPRGRLEGWQVQDASIPHGGSFDPFHEDPRCCGRIENAPCKRTCHLSWESMVSLSASASVEVGACAAGPSKPWKSDANGCPPAQCDVWSPERRRPPQHHNAELRALSPLKRRATDVKQRTSMPLEDSHQDWSNLPRPVHHGPQRTEAMRKAKKKRFAENGNPPNNSETTRRIPDEDIRLSTGSNALIRKDDT